MRPAPFVRSADEGDAPAIASLLGQLGYPAFAGEVAERLVRLGAFGGAIVLVAELEERVVGVVTSHVFPSIHAPAPVAWLTTLVVDERCRGSGVGRTLTAAVERWGRAQGATRLSLTSGMHRGAAHEFYRRAGFEQSGVRLTKELPEPAMQED